MASTDDHTRLLRALLSIVTDLNELFHARHAGRRAPGRRGRGQGCSDDAVAHAASMLLTAMRDVLPTMLTVACAPSCSRPGRP